MVEPLIGGGVKSPEPLKKLFYVYLISRQTLTDRPTPDILAVSTSPADPRGAGVGPAAGPAVGAAHVAAPAPADGALPAAGTVRVGAAGVQATRVGPKKRG